MYDFIYKATKEKNLCAVSAVVTAGGELWRGRH